jgi:hypothetical protein
MKVLDLRHDQIVVAPDLTRSRVPKQFVDRLRSSIEAIGLGEPLKVAQLPGGDQFLIVDGVLRWQCITDIRTQHPDRFQTIPAYEVLHEQRFEVRFQTDIYQDLLPSQLAGLVEFLHKSEQIAKGSIAQYIGVSAPTIRNYTGVSRLLERGGLFAGLVRLMDVGVVPSSNPYAWLRLTSNGIRHVFCESLIDEGQDPEDWIDQREAEARRGDVRSLPLKFVEAITSNLPPDCYLAEEAVREQKRNLGLRRAAIHQHPDVLVRERQRAVRNLDRVRKETVDPVLRMVAETLREHVA